MVELQAPSSTVGSRTPAAAGRAGDGRPELRIAGVTGQHLGDRREQQDRVAILAGRQAARCALGVLADGVGGRSGGALAAESVMLTTQQRFDRFDPAVDRVEGFFDSLVAEVHTVIRLDAVTSGLQPHSTFAAILLQPDRVDWCHVGDSRIYHVRDGRVERCTADHTLGRQLVDQGIPPERARLHPGAHLLVNAMGADRPPEPALGSLADPLPGDTFLLCSDGLWSWFRAQEIADAVTGVPVRVAAESLIAQARARAHGHGDNCTLALFRYEAPAGAGAGG